MTVGARRFVFAPLERRGLLLGLGPSQLACLSAGAVLAVVVLHARPDGVGVVVGLVVATAATTLACFPLAGRTGLAWTRVLTRWLLSRSRGPLLEAVPATRERRGLAAQGVTIVSLPAAGAQAAIGLVRDRPTSTWSVVLPMAGRAFALLDPGEKDRRLAAWGNVLAGSARTGSPIHRLQWVERAYAGDSDSLQRHLRTAGGAMQPGAAGEATRTARAGYADLIASAGPATVEHETFVVLTIRPRRGSKTLRAFGTGSEAIGGLLRREVRMLQGQARNAELSAAEPLDAVSLAGMLRAGFDPGVRRWLPVSIASGAEQSGDGPARSERNGPSHSRPWPLSSDEAWSSLRLDGTWHATFWIAEWPKTEVGPDFLAPLLLAGASRTVSVTMAPVAPERARRLVEAARTAEAADEELRRRAGFLPTARRRREAEGVAQRETELADGHAEFRYSGYVTVSAHDHASLEEGCADIEHAAQQARIDLRRLFGQQREAFTWTLPLGRGLS